MMDDSRSGGSLLGGLSGPPPGGLGVSGGFGGLSPYLNIDPSYLQTQAPEFIFNQDQKRGRMENSFTTIGTSVLVGGVMGGTYGLYDGVRVTGLQVMKGKLRRTQILNHTIKSGGSLSNGLGSIAVIYSSIYCLLSLAHDEDNEAKSCFTGALTGVLYKSTAGLRKCGTAGAFGLGLSALWSFFLKKDDRISDYI